MKLFLRLFCVACALFATAPAYAVLKIDITQGKVEPLPVAIPNLSPKNAEGEQIGQDIARVVSADLERSGLFRPISSSAFIEKITPQTSIPHFPDWRQINAQGLVTGTIQADGEKIRVTFPCGTYMANSRSPARNTTPSAATGAASRISSPTKSIRA